MLDLNEVIKISPNHKYAYQMRGIINKILGNKDEAELDFNKATSLGLNMNAKYENWEEEKEEYEQENRQESDQDWENELNDQSLMMEIEKLKETIKNNKNL